MRSSLFSARCDRDRGLGLSLLAAVLAVGMLLGGGGVQPAVAQSDGAARSSGGEAGPLQRPAQRLTVHPESQFWIHGTASAIDFTCRVNRVDGHAEIPSPQTDRAVSQNERRPKVVVRVPVSAFECGNARMTRDLQEALEMEAHPEIRFELVHATVGEALERPGGWHRIHALGALTIAGTKRLVKVRAAGRALGPHRFRVQGCKPIRMTYFNVEPPTKALGLITVKDRVMVQYDLLAHAPSKTSSPFDGVSVDESPSCPVGSASLTDL